MHGMRYAFQLIFWLPVAGDGYACITCATSPIFKLRAVGIDQPCNVSAARRPTTVAPQHGFIVAVHYLDESLGHAVGYGVTEGFYWHC